MKIIREDGYLIISIPDTQTRYNPYDDTENDEMDMVVGLITKSHNGTEEMGLAYRIDMAYKDKPDQVGEFICLWDKDEESFRILCKELDIEVIKYN